MKKVEEKPASELLPGAIASDEAAPVVE